MNNKKKYVVLEHLQLPNRGFRFWSTNTDNNTKLFDGRVVYKEILFTDSTAEAVEESQKTNREVVPTQAELMEYYRNENK